jgi:uncharacterized protein (DUF488 family)
MATVFTVGHGARPAAELVATLTGAGVTVLLDVRRFPGSRRHPQFGRAALAAALDGAGIAYEWHGETLGGRRSRSADSRHTALRVAAFAAYADHLDTPQARGALTDLLARAEREVPVVMCAETLWWQCHRKLIADALTLRGAAVVHLLGPRRGEGPRWEPHRLSATVRPDDEGWPVYDQPDTLI